MGKQVRFWMMLEDERAFLEFLYADPAVVLIATDPPERKVHILDNYLAQLQPHTRGVEVLIWNQVFPFHDDDISERRIRKHHEDGSYEETGLVYYTVDKSNAPVIEYHPGLINQRGKLVQGRIWADMNRLVYGADGRPAFAHKGADFVAWYDKVATWLRRHFKRVKGLDGYFGAQALHWYQSGGQLRLGFEDQAIQ